MGLKAIGLSKRFTEVPIAHRGYHDCGNSFGSGRPENSMSAFEAALENGFGIEIDLQLTSDNVPVVFHDNDLERLFGKEIKIRELTLKNLQKMMLSNGEAIPTLFDLLNFVSGTAPVLVELKDQDGSLGPKVGELEFEVAKILKAYDGPIAVMSFNPYSVWSFGSCYPKIPRGLVTESFSKDVWPQVAENRLKHLRLQKDLEEVGASFISHEYTDLNSMQVKASSEKATVFSWTIRSENEMKKALKRSQNITFEGFDPRVF